MKMDSLRCKGPDERNYSELLYRQCCNHLYLGQWELAKACALTICRSPQAKSSHLSQLKETLTNVVRNPYIVRKSWTRFPTPSYISFFSGKLLQEISEQEEFNAITKLCSLAEFNIFLEESFSSLPQWQIQELSSLYSALSQSDDVSVILSEETAKFLQTSLLNDPSVILFLLNRLPFPSSPHVLNYWTKTVSNIVFNCLHHCLKQIESSAQKQDAKKLNEFSSKSYLILASIPDALLEYTNHDSESRKKFDSILQCLSELSGRSILEQDRIYISLLSRPTPDFLRQYFEFEDKVSLREIPELFTNEKFNFCNATLLALKHKRHFLDDVLEFSIQCILSGDFLSIQNLLSGPVFSRLMSLILILSWSSCRNDSDFANVVQATKLWQHTDHDDPLLVETCEKFLSNVSFKEHCIRYYMEKFPDASSSSIATKSHTIFSLLNHHSPLDVLQKVFGLKNIDSDLVLELLNSSMQDSKVNLCDNSLLIVSKRDTTVYHGFQSLILIFEAILYSSEINRQMGKSHSVKIPSVNKIDGLEASSTSVQCYRTEVSVFLSSNSIQKAYERFVTERIKAAKQEIQAIPSICYRVEILEDMFSLLFLSSKELYEEPSHDSDVGHEGEERYSTSSQKDASIISSKDDELLSPNVKGLLKQKSSDINNCEPSSSTEYGAAQGEAIQVCSDLNDILNNHSSQSSRSSGSSGISTSGFLCNELIIPDFIVFLKDSILEANADSFKMRKDSTVKAEKLRQKMYNPTASVNSEVLQKRITQLMQYIDEAYWRYKLVKLETAATESQYNEKSVFNRKSAFASVSLKKSSFDELKVKTQPEIGSSTVSGTDTADGSASGLQKRKRKKKKKNGSPTRRLQLYPKLQSSNIVHRMLASPEALLRYCLWQQNEDKALEVIRLCKLHDSIEAQELSFSKQLNQLCDNLKKLSRLKEKKPKVIPKVTKSFIPDIVAIANATMSGLESTETSSAIDQEIQKWKIPQISELMEDIDYTSPAEKCLMGGADNLQSIALADVAMSGGIAISHSNKALEMALQRWTESPRQNVGFSQKKSFSFIPGNLKTIEMFLHLLNGFQTEVLSENNKSSLFFPYLEDCYSFSYALTNYLGPIDRAAFSAQLETWEKFSEHVNAFSDLLTKDAEEKVESDSNDQCYNPKNKFHLAYKELFQTVKSFTNWPTELIRLSPVKYRNYLKKLYVYLQQVTGALLGCKDQNLSTGVISYSSYFSALKESPTEILRKMIEQKKMSQQKIEKFAKGMKVDLVHVLLQVYFPTVPLLQESTYEALHSIKRELSFPGFCGSILNKSEEVWSTPRHPDLVARELLRDLISMAQDVAMAKDSVSIVNSDAFQSLSRHSELYSWMNDCCEIGFVDLELLKSDEEKKAFFINVTNLAWAHALLLEISVMNFNQSSKAFGSIKHLDSDDFPNHSKFSPPPIVSRYLLEKIVQQKTLGYNIGQLGTVSLFDLRYNILHSSFPIPKHLNIPLYKPLFCDSNSLDPLWMKLMPKTDPRQLFVIHDGHLHSPKLEVMYSDTVDGQLDESMRDYLNFYIHVDIENKSVELPQLLDLYSLDFDEGKDPSNSPYEGLLNFLLDFLQPSLSRPLNELLLTEPIQASADASGSVPFKKKLSFDVSLRVMQMNPALVLEYASSPNTEPTAIQHISVCPEQIILNSLKDHCFLLTDLYKLMSAKDSDFNHSDPKSTLLETLQQHPISRLLQQRWNMMSDVSRAEDKHDWFISALSPVPSVPFTLHEMQNFFNDNQWEKALNYIDLFMEFQGFKVDQTVILLRHLILQLLSSTDSSSPWALCISDPVYRAEIVLAHARLWTKELAMACIECCLSCNVLKKEVQLCNRLKAKVEEICVHQEIADVSTQIQSECLEATNVFTTWQEVEEKSIWDQSAILNCIQQSGEYHLVVKWAKLHVIDRPLKHLASLMQIIWHLQQTPSHLDDVIKILDEFENPIDSTNLVEDALPEITSLDSKLQLVQCLVEQVPHEQQCRYLNMILGLKMLKATLSVDKELYVHLVAHPHLLLEQLLMNMETNDADRALREVLEDLNKENYISVSISAFSINSLLESYASKSLELPISCDLTESTTSNTTILDSEDFNFSCESFVMPPTVPKKEEWVQDYKVHTCQSCRQEQFNMFSRRHHCRRCGRVVCTNCSQNTLVVEGYGKYGVRVCDDCYKQTTSSTFTGCMQSPFKSSSFDKRYHMLSSIMSSGLKNSPGVVEYINVKRRTSSVIIGDELACWTLSAIDEENVVVRSGFYYDSAPSVSLCLSILKLHSNSIQCAKFMLTLCDHLIYKLRPRSTAKSNVEVDYYLVLSMVRAFLVNAQVKYHQLLDQEGEALVEIYFERLELIKMLVNAHCTHLIPKDDLLNFDTVRKLRDAVLKEERMSLALEISTNCGLDKIGVWSSWGFSFLRAGDWPAAKEKFKQCLKVMKDRKIKSQESPTLRNIISFIEKCKYPSTGKASSIYKTLSRRDHILKGNTKQIMQEAEPFCDLAKEECLYYLQTYGSHFSTVAFYQRHGLIAEAFSYILNEKCESDVFVEALFIPLLKNSQLSSILQHLSLTDRNLTKSWPYLLSTCRFLQRIGYKNVLYQMQLFMEDYIRAAKSSIAFYLAPAADWSDVYFVRNHHLHKAKKQFECYLVKHRASNYSQANKNVLMLSESEVQSYIQTIKLQEELAQFFKQCDPETLLLQCSPSSSQESNVLTLFSNKNRKSELAVKVLTNAIKVDEGFNLAERLIKEYALHPTSVICSAARELIMVKNLVDYLPHFLQNIKCSFQGNIREEDVIMECIAALAKQGADSDFLIKQLSSDVNKINAYLLSGKLKNAYLTAIKLNRSQDVRRIMKAAEQSGQEAVKKFCERWLLANSQRTTS